MGLGQTFPYLAFFYDVSLFSLFPIFTSSPFRALFLGLLPTQSTHEEKPRLDCQLRLISRPLS